jgi:hypothetical protein
VLVNVTVFAVTYAATIPARRRRADRATDLAPGAADADRGRDPLAPFLHP